MPNIVPVEDEEVSKQLERNFKKAGVNIMTNAEVTGVDTSGKGCTVSVKTKKGEEQIQCDIVLSAVGITPNIEGIGWRSGHCHRSRSRDGQRLLPDYRSWLLCHR
jgi:dihydrolipoamide dehydrogenase